MTRFPVPQSLFGRLVLVFLLAGIAMTAAFLAVNRIAHERYHREFAQSVNRDLAQRYVDADFLLVDQPLTVDTLHRGIGKLAAANPDVDIYLVEPDGTLVASSVPEADWARPRIDTKPIQAFLAGAPAPIMGEDPADPIRRDVFTAAAVDIPACPARYLYIVLRRAQHAPGVHRLTAAYAWTEGAGLLVVAAALAVGLAIGLLRLLTRRLGGLERAMRVFEQTGGREVPSTGAAPGRGDEIDRLEGLFLALARRLHEQMEALRAADRTRRELLTNVSHDLRTPLTTLLTHLESVAGNGDRLTEPERAEYLAVAMRQTRRVIDLVEQLLQAAKLEAGAVVPDPEPFLMCELAQDVVQKFQLTARERGVTLLLEAPPGRGWVRADVGLIERVLDNLIGNALQHAPPASTVRVRLSIREEASIRVEVMDEGQGLSADEAAHVFDRFFRKEKGRSAPAGHAGLGLSIVQGILRLHGATAWVESRQGRGACFAFELQTVKVPTSTGAGAVAT